MAKRKAFYAVFKGRDPLTGEPSGQRVLTDWEETFAMVHGVQGAKYAGFATEAEARAWLEEEAGAPAAKKKPIFGEPAPKKQAASGRSAAGASKLKSSAKKLPEFPPDVLCCYVDGSYNECLPNYGYGLVCVCGDAIVHSAGGAGRNAEAVSMHQIAGELLGAMQALRFALKAGYGKVVILHDYMGVANHATGAWKRTNPFSVTYYDWMQSFLSAHPEMSVTFHKVPAHSGLLYNELADVLAKRSVDMTPDAQWLEMAEDLGLFATDSEDA